MRDHPFINGHYYHVYNRGSDKRVVFLEDADYSRFLFGVRVFNDVHSTINTLRRLNHPKRLERDPISLKSFGVVPKKPLVEVVCYCLMPNHFHLLLKQIKNAGISCFMQKIGVGYTLSFNQKYKRSGVLFQGKFQSRLIENDAYLRYIKEYIYLNPLDIIEPDWKNRGIRNVERAVRFLNSYKWLGEGEGQFNVSFEQIVGSFSTERLNEIRSLAIDSSN